MPQVPGDTCDNCNVWHGFDTEVDKIVLFWETVYCNHILTTCPACGYVTRIYVEFEAFVYTKSNCNLTILFSKEAPDEIVTARAAIEDSESLSTGIAKGEPELPRLWLTQLYDDLRKFEAGEGNDTG